MLSEKKIVTIYSGNYYVTNDPEVVIHTLLGSCVAVCLFDSQRGIGGMNHFMLPQPRSNTVYNKNSKSGLFGSDAMDLMIEQILKMGGMLSCLKAKVFGGARVVESLDFLDAVVPDANINFTLEYLNEKKIPIVSKDIGGCSGRKIFYYLKDHSVLVQRLGKELKTDD
ncbi:MAG: chemotaxis protein CheD [Firmicutes bacterium]|nr:chemotaxis protein CheD [Bacillota bacterium]